MPKKECTSTWNGITCGIYRFNVAFFINRPRLTMVPRELLRHVETLYHRLCQNAAFTTNCAYASFVRLTTHIAINVVRQEQWNIFRCNALFERTLWQQTISPVVFNTWSFLDYVLLKFVVTLAGNTHVPHQINPYQHSVEHTKLHFSWHEA